MPEKTQIDLANNKRMAVDEVAGVQELELVFPDAIHLHPIRRFAGEM